MANPLFEAIAGGKVPGGTAPATFPDAMTRLKADPLGVIRSAGFSIPDEFSGDPRGAVMHLLQTGQVGGPVMQRIQPMLNNLMHR